MFFILSFVSGTDSLFGGRFDPGSLWSGLTFPGRVTYNFPIAWIQDDAETGAIGAHLKLHSMTADSAGAGQIVIPRCRKRLEVTTVLALESKFLFGHLV